MARHNPRSVGRVYEAAEHWRDTAFLNGLSVFDKDKELWTQELFEELDKRFVQNLNAGEGKFLSKLKSQLSGGSPACHQLMAEIIWLIQLFSIKSNIGPDKKREYVSEVWSWSGEDIDDTHPLFIEDWLTGIGSTGTAYNIGPWREIVLVIKAMQNFASLSSSERNRIANDPWEFAEWFSGQPDAQKRQFTHIIQHLLFPDFFERSTAKSDKCKILSYYNNQPLGYVKKLDTVTIDRELLDLRKRLEKEYGDGFDFYSEEHVSAWKNNNKSGHFMRDEIDFESFSAVDFDKVSKKIGSRKEVNLRKKIQEDINSLRDSLKPGAHGGFGHNNPPPEFVFDEDEIRAMEEAIDAIDDGVRDVVPDPKRVAQETYNLQSFLKKKNSEFWKFLNAKKGQLKNGFLTGLGIAAGKYVGEKLLEKLPALWAGLVNLFSSIYEWLIVVLQAIF